MEQPELVAKVAEALKSSLRTDDHALSHGPKDAGETYHGDPDRVLCYIDGAIDLETLARAAIASLTTTADDALRDDAEWLRNYAEGVLDGSVMGVREAKRLREIASRLCSPSPDGDN